MNDMTDEQILEWANAANEQIESLQETIRLCSRLLEHRAAEAALVAELEEHRSKG